MRLVRLKAAGECGAGVRRGAGFRCVIVDVIWKLDLMAAAPNVNGICRI